MQECADSCLSCLFFDIFKIIRCQHHNRRLVSCPFHNHSGGFNAIYIRHFPVQKDNVIFLMYFCRSRGHSHSLFTTYSTVHFNSCLCHKIPHINTYFFHIISNKHTGDAVLLPKLFFLLSCHSLKLQVYAESASLPLATLHGYGSSQKVYNILGDSHTQTCALNTTFALILLSGKRLKNFFFAPRFARRKIQSQNR